MSIQSPCSLNGTVSNPEKIIKGNSSVNNQTGELSLEHIAYNSSQTIETIAYKISVLFIFILSSYAVVINNDLNIINGLGAHIVLQFQLHKSN